MRQFAPHPRPLVWETARTAGWRLGSGSDADLYNSGDWDVVSVNLSGSRDVAFRVLGDRHDVARVTLRPGSAYALLDGQNNAMSHAVCNADPRDRAQRDERVCLTLRRHFWTA